MDVDGRSDGELAEALNRGDASAFDELYRRHKDAVWRLAVRLCGDEADALDVFQDTFAYLLRKVPRLRITARFTTFVYPHVRGLAVEARRRRTAHTGLEPDTLAGAGREPGGGRSSVEEALRGLGHEQREVVLLRFVDGLSGEEMAAALGIPVGTVKSRLHHAIAALRRDPRTRGFFEKD